MEKFQKISIIGALLVIALSTAWILHRPTENHVRIGGQQVSVTIAQTMEEQRQGLSGTTELREGTGMLFPYDHYVTPQFWMKDMNYSIDIVWIRDNQVIGFVESAPMPVLGQELPRYQPDEPINYVLEVPAGFVARYGIKTGSAFEYGPGN